MAHRRYGLAVGETKRAPGTSERMYRANSMVASLRVGLQPAEISQRGSKRISALPSGRVVRVIVYAVSALETAGPYVRMTEALEVRIFHLLLLAIHILARDHHASHSGLLAHTNGASGSGAASGTTGIDVQPAAAMQIPQTMSRRFMAPLTDLAWCPANWGNSTLSAAVSAMTWKNADRRFRS